MLPRDLEARPGELIYPKWVALQKWMRQFRVIAGPGITVKITPDGTRVRAEKPRRWPHPFKVGLNGSEARIGKGTVNGAFPTIGGIPISGLNAAGESVDVPAVDLTEGQPSGKNGFSWVGLRWLGENLPCEILAAPDDGEGLPVGFQPLARIEWTEGFPARIWQIAHHHYNAAAVEGRVYFWAA